MNEGLRQSRQDWIRNRAYVLWLFRKDLYIKSSPEQDWYDAEWEYETFYKPHLDLFTSEGVIRRND